MLDAVMTLAQIVIIYVTYRVAKVNYETARLNNETAKLNREKAGKEKSQREGDREGSGE
jgi:hypothetical protein